MSDDKWETITNIEEVLRELIDLQYHVYTMSQQYGDSDRYEGLLTKLDSGGENSKPPEPKVKFNWTGGGFDVPREDDSIPWEKDMIIYHREAYTPKFFKIVKREKIEFWRKELLNKTDEVLKSMREVLEIE